MYFDLCVELVSARTHSRWLVSSRTEGGSAPPPRTPSPPPPQGSRMPAHALPPRKHPSSRSRGRGGNERIVSQLQASVTAPRCSRLRIEHAENAVDQSKRRKACASAACLSATETRPGSGAFCGAPSGQEEARGARQRVALCLGNCGGRTSLFSIGCAPRGVVPVGSCACVPEHFGIV